MTERVRLQPTAETQRIARNIIRREYGSSNNMMTDKVLQHGMCSATLAYELSKGTGILSDAPIWGVTFVEMSPSGETERRTDISTCYSSEHEAFDTIRKQS